MAQRTVVLLEDDIEGGDANETIPFGLDGTTYEIDLNDKNAQQLRRALEPYVSNARRVSRTAAKSRKSTPAAQAAPPAASSNGTPRNGTKKADGHSAREIRDWARSQSIEVPARGRVPDSVTEAFVSAKANGTPQED